VTSWQHLFLLSVPQVSAFLSGKMRVAALWHVPAALLCLTAVFYADAEGTGSLGDCESGPSSSQEKSFVREKKCGGCSAEGDMEIDCKTVVDSCLLKEKERQDDVGNGEANTCLNLYMDLACYPAFCCGSRETQGFRDLIKKLNSNGCVDKINPVHATVAWKHVSQCSPSKDTYCVGDSACDCAYPKDYISEVPDCCCSEEFMPQRGCIGSEVKASTEKCADDSKDCSCEGGKMYYVQKYLGDKDPADGATEGTDQLVSFLDIADLNLDHKSGPGSASLACRAATFGDNDPAPGRQKVCFCEITANAVPNCCNKVDTWKTHWCRTPQMCSDGEGEVAKDDCPRECASSSTSIVGEWTNGYCQALSDDYDASDYLALMDEKGRKKHKESETKAIKSVKFVCLKTARNYEAFGCQSNQLRDFFKAEDASMGIFLYEQENCNGDAIYDDIYVKGLTEWKEDPYFMRLVLPATPCVSGTSFVTCKYDPEKAALAGDNEGLSDFNTGAKSSPYVGLIVGLVALIYVHLM
jgi:hypothetical protein